MIRRAIFVANGDGDDVGCRQRGSTSGDPGSRRSGQRRCLRHLRVTMIWWGGRGNDSIIGLGGKDVLTGGLLSPSPEAFPPPEAGPRTTTP